MAGHADLHRGPEHGAGFPRVAVALAEMDPVGAEPLGQRHAVVDDEGGIGVGADPLQRFGEPRQLMLVEILDAQLERRDRPGASAALSRSGKLPPTSCGLIRYSSHGSRRGGGVKADRSTSST